MRSIVNLLAVGLSMLVSPARAQLLIRSTSDFELTGDGKNPAWSETEWVNLERRSGEKPYNTRVKLLYSPEGLYIHFYCADQKITATKTEDFAELWNEDVFEIFFWTDEKTPIYFEYEISPLDKELAILVPNFNGEFLGWKPWQYEGKRKTRHAVTIQRDESGNPTAWMGEVFIPFTLLRPLQNVPPKIGTRWRINMYRIDYDDDTRTWWAWQKVRTNFHDYERFGIAEFR